MGIRNNLLLISIFSLSGCLQVNSSKEVYSGAANSNQDDRPYNPVDILGLQSDIQLANRHFQNTFFIEMFEGTGTQLGAFLPGIIRNRSNELGGPCHPYVRALAGSTISNSAALTAGANYREPAAQCATISEASSAVFMKPSESAFALLTRSCDLILGSDSAAHKSDSAVRNAVSKITKISAATVPTALTLPSRDQISLAFTTFHQGKEAPDNVLTALENVSDQAANSVAAGGPKGLEAWRFTLLTLCYSPSWLIL